MNLAVIFSFCSLLLLAYLVPRTDSYSFDNHELNEHLRLSLEEYQYLADEETRGKRSPQDQGHPDDDKFVCKHRHFRTSCCGNENIMRFDNKDKSIGKNCYRNVSATMEQLKRSDLAHTGEPMDFFSCEGLKNMKKKIYCVTECMGKKQGLLNEDGSLNPEKLREFLTGETFKEDWQKDVVSNGLDECLKKDYYKSSFPKEDTSSADETDLNCNPTFLQFISCLHKEIEMGCPEEHQKTNKRCKALREKFVENKKRMIDLMKA